MGTFVHFFSLDLRTIFNYHHRLCQDLNLAIIYIAQFKICIQEHLHQSPRKRWSRTLTQITFQTLKHQTTDYWFVCSQCYYGIWQQNNFTMLNSLISSKSNPIYKINYGPKTTKFKDYFYAQIKAPSV